ncbi:MAG TPA: hypothetical protein VG844_01610 [Terracidiphilus sp.]|nr:hypothetical protein [Terracidiphilus sp.]
MDTSNRQFGQIKKVSDKALAEVDILRDFIDFINWQVGVYNDCLSGFQGNKVRVERQVARVQHPTSRLIESGRPVVVHTSVEDPTCPDVIHHRIIRADEFIATNSEAAFNEQQICWSIIVFIFTYWEDEVRSQIAKIRGQNVNDIKLDELGDLRVLRQSIIHHGGVIPAVKHKKLKILASLFNPNSKISPTHDQMYKIFVAVKQAIGRLILTYAGDLPGALKPEKIVDIAIQND